MSEQPTCGLLYLSALRKYAAPDGPNTARERERLFAAGFISGQAEKVYLGACTAAMFRPSEETLEVMTQTVADVCERYGLVSQRMNGETWISRPANAQAVRLFMQFVPDSEWWHRVRGLLCGVPEAELDLTFQKRRGYMEKCDGTAIKEQS